MLVYSDMILQLREQQDCGNKVINIISIQQSIKFPENTVANLKK